MWPFRDKAKSSSWIDELEDSLVNRPWDSCIAKNSEEEYRRERAEYERLKAKYGNQPDTTNGASNERSE
jgi:hypothetical protein